jgi:hypothetical protein
MKTVCLFRTAATALLIASLFTVSGTALSESYGLLRVYVTDEEGRPLRGVPVRIFPPGFTTASDPAGFVQIRVKSKTYDVSVSRPGCDIDLVAGIEVPARGVKDVVLISRPRNPEDAKVSAPR